MQLFANNVTVYINQSISSIDTTILLDDVSKLPVMGPGDYFTITFFVNNAGIESNWEVVKVTAVTGNECTVVRGFDSTNAREWVVGTVGQMRITKTAMETATSNAATALGNANAAVATADDALSEAVIRVKSGDLAASGGSGLVGWIRSAIGAVATTILNWVQGRTPSIFDWMGEVDIAAYRSGLMPPDITAAIQAAVHHVGGMQRGGKLLAPAGYGVISSPILIPYDNVNIVGAGRGASGFGAAADSNSATLIQNSSTTSDVFHFQCDFGGSVQSMTIRPTGTQTSGAAIRFDGATAGSYNAYGFVRDVTMQSMYDCISATNTALLDIRDCHFLDHVRYGVDIANPNMPDTGDNNVSGSTFYSNGVNATHFHQVSAGGLRVNNCKLLKCRIMYRMNIASGVNTSDLIFSGNSIEGYSLYAFLFENTAGTGSFYHVVIEGNQIAGDPTGVTAVMTVGGSAIWLHDVSISGAITSPSGIGLALDNIKDVRVASVMRGSGTATGINLGNNCDLVDLSGTTFDNWALDVSGTPTSHKIRCGNITDKIGAAIVSANPLPVPAVGDFFSVSGTVGFSTLSTLKQYGKKITLQFQGALTVTHGSGINLAGSTNFATTANDTLTLAWNGTSFVECSRSVI